MRVYGGHVHRDDFGNPSSRHAWARKPREAVARARETIADCIHADPDEIFFTSGGTEADNWAVKGSSGGLLVSAYEHHAVLNAAVVGMAAALKWNCDRMEENADRLDELALTLRDGIGQIGGRAVFLGEGVMGQLPGFVSVSFPGHPAEGMMHLLDLKGIAVSTGAACDSKSTKVSHVLKAINAPNAIAESTLRISLGP